MQNKIATILKSIAHAEYIAQVINPPNEVNINNYSLGQYILIEENIVGLIYNTEIFNPNSISFSRQKEDIYTYVPDLIQETDILLKIILLGSLKKDNNYSFGEQLLPKQIIQAGTDIYVLEQTDIKSFHYNSNKQFQIKYIQELAQQNKLTPSLLQHIKNNLYDLLEPAEQRIFTLLEQNLIWNYTFA